MFCLHKENIMAKVEIDIKKKLIIDLGIHAFSSFGLSEKEVADAVEKDLVFTINERLHNMEGDVGCANGGKAFGYKFKPNDFRLA